MSDQGDKYDTNGEYTGNSSGYGSGGTYKRKPSIKDDDQDGEQGEHDEAASQRVQDFIRELLAEKQAIDRTKFPHAYRLIDQEITKAQTSGRAGGKDFKFADIYRERPIKVAVKVAVPIREHPKFNFVGKILGPKGHTISRLQDETMCKMAILGRGSMRDRAKEDELRKVCDPKYAHLTDDLHVEISAFGPPAEAHARVAYALAEVRKYLIPDSNDTIRQEQMRELELLGALPAHHETSRPREAVPSSRPTVVTARAPPPIPMRTATRTPVVHPRSVMPPKTKILSILDRARVAMEESYLTGYESPYETIHPADPLVYHHPHHSPYSPPPPTAVIVPPPRSTGATTSVRYASSAYAPPPTSAVAASAYADPVASEYHYTHHHPRESTSSPTDDRTWKTSYKSSSSSSSARHTESSRYRTSPYTRPSK